MKYDENAACTLDRENDWTDKMRIQQCSSNTICFNIDTNTYDDKLCAPREKCAKWEVSTGPISGCIPKKYCWYEGYYKHENKGKT
jgi:hypothetical protein